MNFKYNLIKEDINQNLYLSDRSIFYLNREKPEHVIKSYLNNEIADIQKYDLNIIQNQNSSINKSSYHPLIITGTEGCGSLP